MKLAYAAIELNLPLICAIGHGNDSLLFEAACDRACDTPSLFGTFLKTMVDEVNRMQKECEQTQRKLIQDEYREAFRVS